MMNLTVRDLSVAYLSADGQPVPTVHRVSLDLPMGQSLGIVGESGSGKSTLARALMGYCRSGGQITSGEVRLGDQLTASPNTLANAGVRGGLAYVPQNPLSALTPHLTVGEQAAEALRCARGFSRAQAKAEALRLLEATGLPEPARLYQRYPHQLSGGQRQRVVIAAAMASEPKVLILDEPTTALDKTTERQVLSLLQALREQTGCSLIYVSHDLNVIARMCDHIVVMRHGEVLEQGRTPQVFSAPQHPYTQSLLADMPAVRPSTKVLEPVLKLSDAGDAVHPARATPLARPQLATVPKPPALLAVEGLHFSYAKASAFDWIAGASRAKQAPTLQDISFEIAAGQTLGLVGESGSGKSTVAALVSGLCTPTQGQLSFGGEPLPVGLAARTREQRRRIQVVFQDPLASLNPRHKVIDILSRPLQLFFGHDAARARQEVEQLVGALHLHTDLLERYPCQLSGGQQQRVAIARAFAARPELIVCDEITSALDASVQAQVLDNLRQLQQATGVALLFISHDLGVIQQMAQRMLVLKQGRAVACGDTEAIFRQPPDPYTRLLLEASSAPAWTEAASAPSADAYHLAA